jgi:hypothetical protein
LVAALVLVIASEVTVSGLNGDIDRFNHQVDRSTADYEALGSRLGQVSVMDGFAVGTALFGVAAVTTGVLLRLLGQDPERYGDVSLSVSGPSVTVGPGRVGLHLRF